MIGLRFVQVKANNAFVIIIVIRWVLIQGVSIFKSIRLWSIVYTSPVQFCLSFQRKVINCNMSTISERLPKRPWTTAKLSLTKSHHLQKVYLQFWELKSPKMSTKGKYRVCCSSYTRVAELGSLSSGAKMAMKIFVKCVFTIFAPTASFLQVIANLQN